MMRAIAMLAVLSLTGCATTSSQNWTRFADGSLDEWLARDAVPGLTKTLTDHPRFKAETIRVAALDGDQVAGRTNGLTTAVRDAVHAGLLQKPGLNMVRVDGPTNCVTAPADGYYLAIETHPAGSRGANVQIRLFDIVEQQWIGGFGHHWRGDLSPTQRDALRRPMVAESARGSRVLPFNADQSDLLAQQLASDLACQLERHGNDELIVQPAPDRAAALIAGNLAGIHQIPVAGDGVLVLETRVHKIDDRLYQVWALLTPDATVTDIAAIASSAYATRPLLQAARKPIIRTAVQIPVVKPELLSPVSILAVRTNGDCKKRRWHLAATELGDRPVITPGGCFGLEFARDPGAQIYVIRHQVDAGLMRLYPAGCTRHGSISAAATVHFPEQTVPLRWDARSGSETFYVIAARGSRANSRLARLIKQLPDGCHGNDGAKAADSRWLNDIDSAIGGFGDDVAWHAVRVHHQPRTSDKTAALSGEVKR